MIQERLATLAAGSRPAGEVTAYLRAAGLYVTTGVTGITPLEGGRGFAQLHVAISHADDAPLTLSWVEPLLDGEAVAQVARRGEQRCLEHLLGEEAAVPESSRVRFSVRANALLLLLGDDRDQVLAAYNRIKDSLSPEERSVLHEAAKERLRQLRA